MLTAKQMEVIKDNLNSFIVNFGEPRLEKADYGKGVFVYYPANAESYIQYCYDIDYLNGWLYGIVQGNVVRKLCTGCNN